VSGDVALDVEGAVGCHLDAELEEFVELLALITREIN
jgi:hypothetical protein